MYQAMKIMPLSIIKLILQSLWKIYWKFELHLNLRHVRTRKRISLRKVSVSRNQIRPWFASLASSLLVASSREMLSHFTGRFQLLIRQVPISYSTNSKTNNAFRKADSCSTYIKNSAYIMEHKSALPLICFNHLRRTLSKAVLSINAIKWGMILCFSRALPPSAYTYVWHENSITIVLMS
jgi:hypothetical protein